MHSYRYWPAAAVVVATSAPGAWQHRDTSCNEEHSSTT